MDVSPSRGGGVVQVNQTALSSYPFEDTFKSGTHVSVEAVPASDYRFNNWSGGLSGTTNPTTIVIDCDKSITANFSQISATQVSWLLVSVSIVGLLLVGVLVIGLNVRRRAG